MKKKMKKYIEENTRVELPEKLKRENIEKLLEEDNAQMGEVVNFKSKKHTARKVVALAASFALLIGVASVAGQTVKDRITSSKAAKTIVVSCDNYDEIYTQLDAIRAKNKDNLIIRAKDFFAYSAGSVSVNSSADYAADGAVQTGEKTAEASSDYAKTNTQEEDVDEGNVIKTDGKYIYIVDDGHVYITSESEGKLEKITDISASCKEYENLYTSEIYVENDRLVLIGYAMKSQTYNPEIVYDNIYSSYYLYSSGDTFVNIYDISDINNVCLLKQYIQQGGYDSSRITNGNIYCISQYTVNVYEDDYKQNCIPEITNDESIEKIAAEDIAIIPDTNTPVYTIVSSCSIDGNSNAQSSAILGYTDDLYATSENLFLVAGKYDESSEQTMTNIYKFEYTDKGAEFKAEGSVPGYINNQFSLDYEKGYLRIATTYDEYVSKNGLVKEFDDTANALFILDKDMKITGKIENLADGELIKSARYIGDYAYIVTFRQTDPLFVIDLSNPKEPTVVGELSITGFSSYLHPFMSGYLIGIGFDGDEENINEDCKISLFDISDASNPREISKITVASDENSYVYTDIGYNHKKFVGIADNEFAVPFSEEIYTSHDENFEYKLRSVYIRYKLEDGRIIELARYAADEGDTILAASYIGDYFYIFVQSNEYITNTKTEDYLLSYSLENNEQVDKLIINR